MRLHPALRRWKTPTLAVALAAGYPTAAQISLNYITGPDGKTAIYASNAFLIAALLLLPLRWRWACLLATVIGTSFVLFLRNPASPTAIYVTVTASIGALVSIFGASLARRVLRTPRLRNLKQAAGLLAFVILPTCAFSALVTPAWISLRSGSSFFEVASNWLPASLMGMSMVLPTLLMLATPTADRRVNRSKAETLALWALVAGLIAAPHVGLYYVSLALSFPAANLFALRLGGKATALSLLLINLSAFIYPFLLPPGTPVLGTAAFSNELVFGLQIFTVAVFYNGLLTSLAIDHQSRLQRLLERRTDAARKARAGALAASKAKAEFLATMSHEIRTPLNSIIGFSEVMGRRGDLPADALRQLGLIRRAGDSLLTVVNDILDFSKVEAGRLVLDPRPVSVAAVAEDAAAIVAPAAAAQGLSLEVDIGHGAGAGHLVDDHRLRQILLNLLNNAVKFTTEGGVRLSLAVRPAGPGFDRLRVAVSDTGIGIDAETAQRLFQRFSQADSSTSRSYGGTGLGLSICKGLVELMGGRIGVESEPGKGSTFWFELTLERAELASAPGGSEEEGGAVEAHILLVDDNAANRELGVAVLTLIGCTADTAANGEEAVAAARTGRYDAVLMDVHMPVMDGLAATRAIRAMEGAAGKVPIIAMSADVLPEQVARCREAGMVDAVPKPINIGALSACLSIWIGRDAEGRELAA